MSNVSNKNELSYSEQVEMFKELIFGKAAKDDFEPKKGVFNTKKPTFPAEKQVDFPNKVEQSASNTPVGSTKEELSTDQLILKAAEEVFVREGFAGATTSAIAKAAGVTHAMLHYYFNTKENLFKHIFQQKIAELSASLIDSFGGDDLPFAERIVNGAKRHFDFLMQNPELPTFVVRDIVGHPGRTKLIQGYFNDFMGNAVASMQEQADELARRGELAKIKITDLFLNIASLNVFAFLILPAAEALEYVYDTTREQFLEQRKQEIAETLRRRLKP